VDHDNFGISQSNLYKRMILIHLLHKTPLLLQRDFLHCRISLAAKYYMSKSTRRCLKSGAGGKHLSHMQSLHNDYPCKNVKYSLTFVFIWIIWKKTGMYSEPLHFKGLVSLCWKVLEPMNLIKCLPFLDGRQ